MQQYDLSQYDADDLLLLIHDMREQNESIWSFVKVTKKDKAQIEKNTDLLNQALLALANL